MLYYGTILVYYLANYLYTQCFLLLSLEMGNNLPNALEKWVTPPLMPTKNG